MPGSAASVGAAVMRLWLATLFAGVRSAVLEATLTVAVRSRTVLVAMVMLIATLCCARAGKRPKLQVTVAPPSTQARLAPA